MRRVEIIATPVYCHVQAPRAVLNILRDELSFEVQGHFFAEAYQRGFWDGRRRLFDARAKRFQTGLLPRVVKILRRRGFEVEVQTEQMPRYDYTPFTLRDDGLEKRDYQRQAAQTILKRKRGLVELPPRSGKTVIFALVQAATGLTPSLFICPQVDIVDQTAKLLRQLFPKEIAVGVYQGSRAQSGDVLVCTFQTLLARLKSHDDDVLELLRQARLVAFDEVHHVASTGNQKLFKRFEGAEILVGFSATAFREDGTDLLMEQAIGPKIFKQSYSDLINRGYLAQPTFHIFRIGRPKQRYPSEKKQAFARALEQEVLFHPERNEIIVKCAQQLQSRGKTCVIPVSRLAHGELLADMIPGAVFLHAKSADRTDILDALRRKELSIVVSTLLDEGVDIPSLDATIIACAGKSAIKAFQRLRCLTRTETKKTCIVVDFNDPGKFFRKHFNRRHSLYTSEPAFRLKYR